jgi:hypothetical protein
MSFDILLARRRLLASINAVPIFSRVLEGKVLRCVRLIRKLAASLNGFNLSQIDIGDVIELPDQTATMLIAEGWAEPLTKILKNQANDQITPSRSSTNRKQK